MKEINKHDAENCDACAELLDECLYHEGVSKGWRMAMDLIRAVADDSEATESAYANALIKGSRI